MKDLLIILRRNFFTANVLAIYILPIILLVLNEKRDAFFVSGVITINTIFGIIQEIRARRELKKLELMSAPRARLIKSNDIFEEVLFDQLNPGDKIKLLTGDEVPADAKIVTSYGLEVNEGIMTGESASIEKEVGANIFAASVVTAGSAIAEVVSVGLATKVGKMSATLKRYRPRLTPTQRSIAIVITTLTYGALALSVLIYIVYSLSGENAVVIFKTITSSAVAIVPDGLLLASTVLLAYGSIRLARAKVLPQKIASIEAMALLNVLCVDKTGTLTSDEIKFEKLEVFEDSIDDLSGLIAIVAKETSGGNMTGAAISRAITLPDSYQTIQTLAFSSTRKISGVRIKIDGINKSIIMGAPEYIEHFADVDDEQKSKIHRLSRVGKRVLLVAIIKNPDLSLKSLSKNDAKAVAMIVLSNELRDGVKNTVTFLQKRGVVVKVISGDNPNTVRYVAKKAGINNYQKVITGAELSELNKSDFTRAVLRNVIFARILPEQKQRIVGILRKAGFFTGMIGDGVNDALALKNSDLGIAMYDGAIATRRIADMVLMDNSFNSLPIGMRLGNRILQSIELIAVLFFHKIIQWIVLLAITLVLSQVYPFVPRHITFMNMFLVTMPTIMWTLFTPLPKSRISPKFFWKDTLLAILPIAILSGLSLSFTYSFLLVIHPSDVNAVLTTTVIVATIIGVYLVFLAPIMFNIKQTKKAILARYLYVLAVVIVFTTSFGIGFLRDFFDFTMPAWRNTWPLVIVLVCIAMLQWKIASGIGHKLAKRVPN